MPIPGGIGVTEGALTVGLTAAGLPESTAFAVAILYRLASFYLPPVWGWFAFRWLQTNKYL
jgi:glycosyltransferase 2 family protein